MEDNNRIIRFFFFFLCICGMCDPVLPSWTRSHPHRKWSIKAMPCLPFFSSPSPSPLSPLAFLLLTDCGTFQDGFIQHSFTCRCVCPPLLFIYLFIYLSSFFFFFTTLPPLRSCFITRDPNTKTTSSHPIPPPPPLIWFKWHGREGQNGN